ncbi:CocE/NonD family hydrolase [Actinomadura sp. KC345]|uniref:CocE/NonD family hydrolase n=1 Tax=Actinomadura sp. KC345 TaxID=2530371 RepID=UPI00104D1DC1|nr:CocE/NonD family hydrolase [Actinomadura sp. KC345]TDC47386.1 CocE/NonD family hydrolase [Actinomadura sp. KC345]
MRTVTALPYAVREDHHVWIPMSDGVRLSARIWRPVVSDDEPVPVILEFIPYRKRDLTAVRDSMHHPYMAGHGYACVRVDLRGTGDSEGVLTDEYLERELLDAEELLAWFADQPWSNGRAGMMGISWGGFNALQVAARRPPSLHAIAALAFSDDRYSDDVHYMGGCLLSDNLSWASTMFAYTSCPPDPAVVGDQWRDMWRERLENSGLWLEHWLSHQHRDAYWRHGSIAENYSDVQCPVLAVSGWADGYSNAVFRVLANLKVPTQGLIGPWSHKYPHLGEPGPAIGFLQELVRWWDRWLKDVENGVMDEPSLRIWMQEAVPPSTAYEERPGRWVGEDSWPSPRIPVRRHPLERNRIAAEDEEVAEEELTVESPLSVGQFAGKWCSYNAPPDLPYDQREEDGGSLVFDSDILDHRCEILGSPVVRLVLAVTGPQAMVAVRLSDVAPDGRATRVTYGLLNLTHRTGHEMPRPLEPGQRYDIAVTLNGMAHAFPPGHRIRLSVSTSYWPLAWPPPRPVRLALYTGACFLELPTRPVGAPGEPDVSPFGEPEVTPPVPTTLVRAGEADWTVNRNLANYESALNVVKDLGVVRIDDIGMEIARRAVETYGWTGDDFTSVFGDVEWRMAFSRGEWDVSTVTRTKLTSTETDFIIHAELDAYESDRRVHSRNWAITIPRNQL